MKAVSLNLILKINRDRLLSRINKCTKFNKDYKTLNGQGMGRMFILGHLTWNWKRIPYFLGALAFWSFIVDQVSWKSLGIIYFQGNHCCQTKSNKVFILYWVGILTVWPQKSTAWGNNSLGYSLYQVATLKQTDQKILSGQQRAICILCFEKPIWRLASSSWWKITKKNGVNITKKSLQ